MRLNRAEARPFLEQDLLKSNSQRWRLLWFPASSVIGLLSIVFVLSSTPVDAKAHSLAHAKDAHTEDAPAKAPAPELDSPQDLTFSGDNFTSANQGSDEADLGREIDSDEALPLSLSSFAEESTPTEAATPLTALPESRALETELANEPAESTDELADEPTNEPKDESINEATDESLDKANDVDNVDNADEPTEPTPSDSPETDTPAEASADSASNDRWQFSVEPYFFVPLSVQADVTAAGRSASIDLGLDDVLNLDRAFDAGLRLEARRNRLGFILDAFYISAGQSGTLGVTFPESSLQRFGINTAARVEADASISIREVTVDTAVSYRVVDAVLNNSTELSNPYPRLVVAPIVGLRTRFSWQELEVDSVRLGNLSLPIDREFDASRTTVEPLVGGQISLDLSNRLAFNIRGDVSGFNINAEEDFTWNLLVGGQYHLSRSLTLQLAYRFNGFDFEDGEGLRRARLNLYQNGVWLSGIIRF